MDAVVVSSPNSTHVKLAEVIAAGKHLFLKNPAALRWLNAMN